MKRWSVLFVMPALALSLAACGGGSPKAEGSSSPRPEDMRLKWTNCMREHGAEVDDNQVSQEIVEKAFKACKKWESDAGVISPRDPATKEKFTNFARCMRKNGIDFPDPGPNGELPPPDFDGGNKQRFDKGMEVCSKHLPGASGQ